VALDREEQEVLLGSCAGVAGLGFGLTLELTQGVAKLGQSLVF
jgi:hypothetical protein